MVLLSAALRPFVRAASTSIKTSRSFSSLIISTCSRTAAAATAIDVQAQWRSFSSLPPTQLTPLQPIPPGAMNEDMARGIQIGTALYINHGVGRQRLLDICNDTDTPLVIKWQRCMEAFLGTQVHVLAGLGYSPDEHGIGLYHQQLSQYMQTDAPPNVQEEFRLSGRDTWRVVLGTAFGIDPTTLEEMEIVEARNIMHKVAQKMMNQDILDAIAKDCASIEPNDSLQIEMALKHHVVQEALVHKVYLGGEPTSLVEDCGFGGGAEGYVRMQMTMAEHQNDPLVAQYIGTAMMQILKVAGLDAAVQQQAAAAGGADAPTTASA